METHNFYSHTTTWTFPWALSSPVLRPWPSWYCSLSGKPVFTVSVFRADHRQTYQMWRTRYVDYNDIPTFGTRNKSWMKPRENYLIRRHRSISGGVPFAHSWRSCVLQYHGLCIIQTSRLLPDIRRMPLIFSHGPVHFRGPTGFKII
jgi:hypothetical protein